MRLSRRTKKAATLSVEVLQRAEPAAAEQLQADAARLAEAPRLRIHVARKKQGASARRETLTEKVFAMCVEIRRRVKIQFRGPRHSGLRSAFGVGVSTNAQKPGGVEKLGDQILKALDQHPEVPSLVRLARPTCERLAQLVEQLRNSEEARSQAAAEIAKVVSNLMESAARIEQAARKLPKDGGR